MTITVIICTYNRAHSLGAALDSVLASAPPSGREWEILVVDNNSKDNTGEVINEFCLRYPGRVRYLLETKQGLSNARNAGIRGASGEILAFTDDDVIVESTWLQDLTSVFEEEEYAGSAGRILPARDIDPPPWLALEGKYNLIGALCAHYDMGDSPRDLTDAPYGANMAFRKKMFEKYGGFRSDLGHSGNSLIGSEDTEFGRRLLAGGERLRYVPSATVYHEICQERISKEFILTWWFAFGRGGLRESEANLTPFETFKTLGRTLATALQGLFAFDPKRRFYCKCRVWFDAGRLCEASQRAIRAR